MLCHREHSYELGGGGTPAPPADLGFLSSSCPTVRLTTAVVILRLLFSVPPASTVHLISAAELTKVAAVMVATECSGDCLDSLLGLNGLAAIWGMLKVGDYDVVMSGVKTLLYVVQGCNENKELKYKVVRWCCEDAGFGDMVAGVFEEDTRLKENVMEEVREVVAILLQIVGSCANTVWKVSAARHTHATHTPHTHHTRATHTPRTCVNKAKSSAVCARGDARSAEIGSKCAVYERVGAERPASERAVCELMRVHGRSRKTVRVVAVARDEFALFLCSKNVGACDSPPALTLLSQNKFKAMRAGGVVRDIVRGKRGVGGELSAFAESNLRSMMDYF